MAKKKPRLGSGYGKTTLGGTTAPAELAPSLKPRVKPPTLTPGAAAPPPVAPPAPPSPVTSIPPPQPPQAPAADPMAALSPASMQDQAVKLAMAQIQPQLNTVNQQQTQAASAHDTRNQQLQDWAKWQQGNLDSAFGDTRNALNQLVSLQGGTDQASQASLAAALRSSNGASGQAAALSGVSAPQGLEPGVLSSAADANKSAELGVGAGAGGLIGLMGANRSLGSVGLGQNTEQERQRFNAVNQGFQRQQTDLTGQVPGLVASQLKDLQAFELSKAQFGETKANDLFQRYLATKQLGDTEQNQSFQQWLSSQQLTETHRANVAGETQAATNATNQNAIDWANVGINKTQAEATLAGIRQQEAATTDTTKKDALKARGDSMQKALVWLGSYMAPQKGEASSSHTAYPYGGGTPSSVDPVTSQPVAATATYQRTYNDALQGLQNYTSRSDALRILSHSNFSDWRKKAQQELTRLKRRPLRAVVDRSLNGGTPLPPLSTAPVK